MRLYIETMDAVLVEVADDGRVKFQPPSPEASAGQGPPSPQASASQGSWTKPTLQERRAIIHAAQNELEDLKELLETLERSA